ncbi:MAG TPA: hypothetical protein EYP14_09435, partial [Planctomycetaceae bacterium]|nr:hypothetical protein [Planctomycetaceae bacterium]
MTGMRRQFLALQMMARTAGCLALICLGLTAVPSVSRLSAQGKGARSPQSPAPAHKGWPGEKVLFAGSDTRPSPASPTPPRRSVVPEVRAIRVPADRPDDWPEGRWLPLPWSDYRSLVDSIRPQAASPRDVWIERAVYSAEFDPETGELSGGELHFRFGGRSESSRLVTLEPLDLLITQLRWPDAEAVWGTASDGKTKVLVEPGRTQLHGRWRFLGRRILDRTEFDVHLAPSLISTLILRVPDGYTITCSPGVISPLPPGGSPPGASADSGSAKQSAGSPK